MTARFLDEQPQVNVVEKDGVSYVYLCLDGTYETDPDLGVGVWIYQYHEFHDKTENLDLDDIEGRPEAYLDYVPKEKTELDELKEQLSAILNIMVGGTSNGTH